MSARGDGHGQRWMRCDACVLAVVAVAHPARDRTAVGPARRRDQRNPFAFTVDVVISRMPMRRMPRSRTIRSGMRRAFRSSMAIEITSLSSAATSWPVAAIESGLFEQWPGNAYAAHSRRGLFFSRFDHCGLQRPEIVLERDAALTSAVRSPRGLALLRAGCLLHSGSAPG